MHKSTVFLLGAVLSLGFSAPAQADSATLFPPENLSDCHEGSLLRWDGPGHNVRCEDEATLVLPTGTVLAFKLDACPFGWGPLAGAEGRVIVGAGDYSEANFQHEYTVGETGGLAFFTMKLEQMPRHSHKLRLTGRPDDHDFNTLWRFDFGANGYLEFDWTDPNDGSTRVVEIDGPPSGLYGHSLIAARGDNLGPYATNGWAGGKADGMIEPTDNRQPYLTLLYCVKLSREEYGRIPVGQ